jgi:aspartate/glutamate/glutamine transport system permease protein
MRIVLPPLTNQAVSLIKNTSVIAIIAGGDLMYAGDSFAGRFGHYGPTYVLVGLGYFLLCFPLAIFARRLEERTRVA